ncbi:hypothetical protein RvY_05824 [Ramazzottius varieornatus]|uniref:Uncharacterized protein n=1 Tax=Ramazzottius varieornatus TaxID=947166 RepID=A0A1D1UWE5_RAMVA|nr:hypothetical protein RvY_05824 [Ramazzottius varieornatus]
MVSINLLNFIKLLEWDYKLHYRIDDFPSEADRQFKDIITQSVTPVYAVEEDLQYDLQIRVESFEDYEASAVQCNLLNGRSEADFDVTEPDRLLEPVSSGTEPSSHELCIPRLPNPKLPVDQLVNLEYKKRARNAVKKTRLTLATVQRSFGKVTSIRQLYEWKKQKVEGGSRLDKLKALRLDVGKQFFLAKRKKQVVKDLDLRRWALTANETVNLAGFTAPPDWIGKLGRSRIAEYGLDCLWNADQSGFEYDMRPGRTLETAGVKHVEAIIQSENSMTHGHTKMMAVSPGKQRCIFLADLWKTFTDQHSVIELKPEELE